MLTSWAPMRRMSAPVWGRILTGEFYSGHWLGVPLHTGSPYTDWLYSYYYHCTFVLYISDSLQATGAHHWKSVMLSFCLDPFLYTIHPDPGSCAVLRAMLSIQLWDNCFYLYGFNIYMFSETTTICFLTKGLDGFQFQFPPGYLGVTEGVTPSTEKPYAYAMTHTNDMHL